MEKTKNKLIFTLLLLCFCIPSFSFAAVCENLNLKFKYDGPFSRPVNDLWQVCPYTSLLNEQSALYKSMEHVNWISIEKIIGKGGYCLNSGISGTTCDNASGLALENPGIVQKIDLWRQRLKTYQEAKELRPYYDSQIKPKREIDDKYDENRMALLNWLSTTRTKTEQCVKGYSVPYKGNMAKIRSFACQEGVTATSAQGYRILPDFPYPVRSKAFNCFPLNADYLSAADKEQCFNNKDQLTGCQSTLKKKIWNNSYLDDFYCTSGRQQVAK